MLRRSFCQGCQGSFVTLSSRPSQRQLLVVPRLVHDSHARWASGAPKDAPPESWADELERRRSARLRGESRPIEPGAAKVAAAVPSGGIRPDDVKPQASDEKAAAMEAEEREDVDNRAMAVQLFAYPRNRRFPWTTLVLLVASSGLTASVALYWRYVCGSSSLEELRPRLKTFTDFIEICSVDRAHVAAGELHRLVLASCLRAGEQPARAAAEALVLACCGTLVERLYGPGLLLALVGSCTVVGNISALAALEGEESASVASTSGAVVGVGAFCVFLHGRWAIWPGLPVPVAWLLTPLLVADAYALAAYLRDLRAYRESLRERVGKSEDETRSGRAAHTDEEFPRGFALAVALGACEAAEARAKRDCMLVPGGEPAAEDITAWREDLERAAQSEPRPPPDCAVWADVASVAVAALIAMVVRMRRGF